MKFVLLVACLASLSLASGHVISVYNGMNLPIRTGTGASDGVANVNGPCGGGTTFGSNGITSVVSGTVLNMQLRYQQPHPTGTGAPNTFSVAMACSSNMADLSNDGTNLRQYGTGAQTQNGVAIAPISVADANMMVTQGIPFTFPFTTPSGSAITAGQYCTVAIMDERNWGGCVDLQVKTAAGPIVAGVMTPVIGVGAAAAIFFARGTIAAKLLPKPEDANAQSRLMQSGALALITLVLACVACAVPKWAVADAYTSGPWMMCPANGACYNSATGGLAAITAVRVFIITPVIAAAFALLMPLLAWYNRLDANRAALISTAMFGYMGTSTFIAIMLWACILSIGSKVGAAFIIAIVVCILSFFGCMRAYIWLKATEMVPAGVSSGPIGLTSTGGAAIIPSYPSQQQAGKPYAAANTSSPTAAKGLPPPPAPAHLAASANKKWGSWEEMWDEENACFYFFNHSSGESLWEAPAGWPHPARA